MLLPCEKKKIVSFSVSSKVVDDKRGGQKRVILYGEKSYTVKF